MIIKISELTLYSNVNKKSKFIAFGLFIVFFLAGLEIGFSPVRNIITTFKESTAVVRDKIFRIPKINVPADYISENQYKIDILHYSLDIDLYTKDKILVGEAVITGLILDKSIEEIHLNFYDNFDIDKVLLNGNKTTYTNKNTRLSIPLISKTDTFKVTVNYKGRPKRLGLSAFVFGELDGKSVVYNLSEPTFASTWFPCNDLPDDKALLDIKITNDINYTSVSNGILVGEEFVGSRKTFHWKTIYPISTYLVSVYSAEYVNFSDIYISPLSGDTMKIEYYVFPEHYEKAKIDFAEHRQMMEFFAEKFGEYPFIKEKYGVAEFLWQLGAMENQTITGVGSNFISGRKFFNDLYVHELAHHWWGNAVGLKSWKDIWLNEGFATYSEALYAESKAGSKALQSKMLSKFQDNFYGRLYDPGEDLFSTTIYDKGAWVLHMLRWEVGDEIFFDIMREYFERYKYASASVEDFKDVSEELSQKNLTKFFDQWIFAGDDQIKMDINWNIESSVGNKHKIKIEVNQFQDRYEVFHFPIELQIQDKNGKVKNVKFYVDQRSKIFINELDFEPSILVADPNNWLLANINVVHK